MERNIILKDNTLSEVILFNTKLLKRVQIRECMANADNPDNGVLDLNNMSHFFNKDKNLIRSQMVELVDGFKQRKEKP